MDLLIMISCFQAKRALRALRGLVRLKSLMEGPVVKRQAASTLRCMQTLSRVQCQIRTRRIRMTEENQALQRQLLQKHAKELVNLQVNPLFLWYIGVIDLLELVAELVVWAYILEYVM